MPRAYSREPTRPDMESGQTHDDCEWLNEEDGEEDVLGHWRDGYRRRRTPCVTQDESRDAGGQDNPSAENRPRDDGRGRGVGLIRILALGRCAATVGLRLCKHARGPKTVRIALVHRALVALRAAGHARFRRRQPAGAYGRIPGEEPRRQKHC
jgi:hypothetical protein